MFQEVLAGLKRYMFKWHLPNSVSINPHPSVISFRGYIFCKQFLPSDPTAKLSGTDLTRIGFPFSYISNYKELSPHNVFPCCTPSFLCHQLVYSTGGRRPKMVQPMGKMYSKWICCHTRDYHPCSVSAGPCVWTGSWRVLLSK